MRATAILLVVQAVLTGVTGLVLFASPEAIPKSFGLALTPDAHLLCYLYGATELGLCLASITALRLGDVSLLSSACTYFAAVHAAEALAGVLAVSQGRPSAVLANSAAQGLVALLFAMAASRRRPAGPDLAQSRSR